MNFRKYSFLMLLAFILSIALMSCASTPEETETETVTEEETVAGESTTPETESEDNDYFLKMTEAQKSAEKSKAAADNVRAAKGAPEGYKTAEELYARALEAREKKEFKVSAEYFVRADEAYQLAITRTEENKQAALEAMRAMDNAIDSTEKKAADAVREAEEEDKK